LNDPLPPELPLGKPTAIPESYAPEVLVALPRALARARLEITETPFIGMDRWEAPELSWLDGSGKPCVALGEFRFASTSEMLIESKSLKLYLHSLNQDRFGSDADFRARIVRDLSGCAGCDVEVLLHPVGKALEHARGCMPGTCIDTETLENVDYTLRSDLLEGAAEGDSIEETLTTHLFRSLCPVTRQPDWASLALTYRGPRIARDKLLRYWISFRSTQAFHESCVERMFMDLDRYCRPEWVELDARFALRGGLAIHPLRKSLQRT